MNPSKYEDLILARILDLDKEDTRSMNTTCSGGEIK